MDPVAALRQIAYYKDRAREDSRRVMAYRNAADVVERLDDAQRESTVGPTAGSRWPASDPRPRPSSPRPGPVANPRCWSNCVPTQKISEAARFGLRSGVTCTCTPTGRTARRPISEMMAAAKALGHEYCALTDHSPRLTVANGLSADRLREQLDVIDELRETFAPMRILTGIEVDILDDGSLDQDDDLLERLDVVVASVHSKLKMDSASMTRRMVRAVSGGQADVLGHCTGRLVEGGRGTRAESAFDAEKVFTACRDHGTAVEINSRPERRDPPTRLLTMALEIGCDFSIDTDAHAPGQLDFLGYGAQRALDNGVPVDRIVNTWPLEKLLAWTTAG